jgi:hypothetical protein
MDIQNMSTVGEDIPKEWKVYVGIAAGEGKYVYLLFVLGPQGVPGGGGLSPLVSSSTQELRGRIRDVCTRNVSEKGDNVIFLEICSPPSGKC